MWYTYYKDLYLKNLYFTEDKNMCLFSKPEKPKYGKVVLITLGAVAAVAAIAYAVYKFVFEYKQVCDCEDYLDECDFCDEECECECDCDCCECECDCEEEAVEAQAE